MTRRKEERVDIGLPEDDNDFKIKRVFVYGIYICMHTQVLGIKIFTLPYACSYIIILFNFLSRIDVIICHN